MQVQSFTFNSRIPDDKLRELIAPAEVIEIKRASWITWVSFTSSENADELGRKVEKWFQDWQDEQNAIHERKCVAIYEATCERLWKDVPGIPGFSVRKGKPTLKGYYFIDDDDKMQFVFPED